MKVGHVRMRMHDRGVFVNVTVSPAETIRVGVVVMAVGVLVLVRVLHCVMVVLVEMGRTQ